MKNLLFTLDRSRKLIQGIALYKDDWNLTIAYQLELQAGRRPDKTFLLYRDRRYTYGEANALINQHSHAYKARGVAKGDVVALVMENRPEFLWHLFGLNKIGAVCSLINSNLTGEGLAHAIRICEPRCVSVGSEVWANYVEVRDQLADVASGVVDVDQDPDETVQADVPTWSERLEGVSRDNPPESGEQQLGDLSAYIYTSGTTGLPKAALVRHARMFRAGRVWAGLAYRYRSDDILYNCLPLYHSNSIMLATGSAVTAGITMHLTRKFSRSRFWEEMRESGATSFIYIGELCRYLMNADPSPADRDHKVRVISGNGLRPDIWQEFQERFGIERVAEFYGATEGNCITVNVDGAVGSVGYKLPGMELARWDEENQEFIRRDNGMLMKAKAGEKGVLLGKIRVRQEFDGYRDKSASEKKVMRDVFESGDAYFDTGDLMRLDDRRHLYFVDRLGDTFRWKGENVSTTEVQEQLSQYTPVHEVNVFGVQIQGADGRAGMASMVLADGTDFDEEAFRKHVDESLPVFARPIFVRLQKAIETTGTLKMKKTDLQKQGFNPGQSEDPIYFRHPEEGRYVAVDTGLYEQINSGKVRL